jgi:hypothetical protein
MKKNGIKEDSQKRPLEEPEIGTAGYKASFFGSIVSDRTGALDRSIA